MPTYDSLFTDRIFLGQNDTNNVTRANALDLSDPNSLTSKLWKKVPITTSSSITYGSAQSPYFGVFFVVKKFDIPTSKIIYDNIAKKGKVYFDNNGNIDIISTDASGKLSPNGSTSLLSSVVNGTTYPYFKNPLTTSAFTTKQSIFTDKSGNTTSLVRDDLIFSPNKNWILYKEIENGNPVYFILYNPIHRSSFKNYYNDLYSKNKTTGGALNSDLNNLFNQYCEICSKNNDIKQPRDYADNTCKCLRIEDRIDNLVGGYVSDPTFRNFVKSAAACYAPECAEKLEVDNGSFMYLGSGINGFKDKVVKDLLNGNCPDIKNVLCQVKIQAGDDVNLTNTRITQECGEQETTKPPETTTTTTIKPADTTTTTKPADTTTTTKPPSTTTTTTKPPSTTIKPSPETPAPQDNTGMYVGIAVGAVVLVVAAVIIFYKMRNSPTKKGYERVKSG